MKVKRKCRLITPPTPLHVNESHTVTGCTPGWLFIAGVFMLGGCGFGGVGRTPDIGTYYARYLRRKFRMQITSGPLLKPEQERTRSGTQTRVIPSSVSAPARRLYRGDVNLFHGHHRVEHALGHLGIGVGYTVSERARSDLP